MKTIVKAKGAWSMYERDVMKAAFAFGVEQLFLEDQNITMKLMGYDPGQGGAMVYKTWGNRDEYIIWVNHSWCIKYMIETVLHELTHVQQAVEGRFPVDEADIVEDTESDDYWNAPHEVEARKIGKKLRKLYFKTLK